jgi:hypothetical protein
MKIEYQHKSNCDLAYMTSFWKENKLVKTKKRTSRRAHGLEDPNVS